MRRAFRKDVIQFPGQSIPSRGRPPVIEFTWELRRGTVRGLARVYASVDAAEVKADIPTYGWLPDGATVVVGAPT
jgi:hypothetical protein